MKKKNKKLNLLKIIFIIICLIFLINFLQNIDYTNIFSKILGKEIVYKNIADTKVKKYDDIGQEKVKDKDGYTTTFTSGNKIYKEYKQNGNSSWSQKEYWGGSMEDNGCGITVMSIILSGYGYEYTPEDLRIKYFPVMNYEKMKQELEEYGIENSGFSVNASDFANDKIINHLKLNKPILVCVWANYGSNRWTEKSHYMAILATDGEEKIYISNPNGLDGEYNSSGWYSIEEVLPYIAKILFIET